MSAPRSPEPRAGRGPRLVRAGLLALVAVGILSYGGQSLARVWQMKQEVEALERELVTLRGETEALAGQIDRLRSDPDYVEQLARESLGMVKPGERVFKLPRTPGG